MKKTKSEPVISIEKEQTVRRAYSLARSDADLIEDYAEFLSEFSKTNVKPGDIVGKLVGRLEKDPLFLTWRERRILGAREASLSYGAPKFSAAAETPENGSGFSTKATAPKAAAK